MSAASWVLLPALLALLGVVQGGMWLLARGLGVRMGRTAVVVGMALPLVLLAPWLASERLLVPTDVLRDQVPGAPKLEDPDPRDLLNDAVFQLIPWELEVRHAYAEGRLPLWSDLLAGGSSPWVNPQTMPLGPLALLARPLPVQHFLLAMLALKLLVAFQGTWVLARRVGAGRRGSLFAGASFALGGGVVAWALYPISATVVWVPWMAAGSLALLRRSRPRAVAVTAVAFGAALLSGNPETALAGGLFAALVALGLRRRRASLVKGLSRAGLAAVLGLGLAAPQIVPFLLAAPASLRAEQTVERSLPPVHLQLRVPMSWFYNGQGRFLYAPVDRHVFGRPFHEPFRGAIDWLDAAAPYAGIVALAGAVAALFGLRRRRAAWPFLAFAAAGLILASHPVPLVRLLHLVPPLRVPSYLRLLPVMALALSVAGGLGMRRLLGRRPGVGAWVGGALAALAGLLIGPGGAAVALWAGLGAGLALARYRPRWGALALGAVLLLDLVPWARDLLPAGRPELFYPPSPVLEAVGLEVGEGGAFRAAGHDYLVYPALLTVYGIPEVRPHDAMAPAAQMRVLGAAFDFTADLAQYFAPFHNLDHPLLDFLGVRAVVSNRFLPAPATLEPVAGVDEEPYRLWRNPDALPRWFLAREVEVLSPPELEAFLGRITDPRRVAVYADEAGEGARDWGTPSDNPVEVRQARPGRAALELPSAPAGRERLLATSLPFPAGWRAAAPGKGPLRRLTVNGAFLGVVLPPEVTRLELTFTPPGFLWGWVLFLLAAPLVAWQAVDSGGPTLKTIAEGMVQLTGENSVEEQR